MSIEPLAKVCVWNSIANLTRTQSGELLNTLQAGSKYIENESFESTFNGLFSEINLGSDKLGRKYEDRNAKLCAIIAEIAKRLAEFSTGIDALGEAEIDFAATHASLVEIENAIQIATAKHNAFLKDLGKALLPSARRTFPSRSRRHI